MAGMTVAVEVTGAVAGLTIAAASRTERGIGGRCICGTGGGIMTGGAGVMNLVVSRINRGGKGRPLDQGVCMASGTIDMIINPSGMVGLGMAHEVSAMTGITVTTTSRSTRGLSRHCIGHNIRANNLMTG